MCTKLATTTVRLDANNTSYTSRPGPLHDQPDQEPEKSKERFVSNSDEHRLLLTFDVLSRLCLLIHTSAAVSSHGDYSSLRDGTLPIPIRFCFRGGVFDVIFVFDSIFSTRCVRFLIVRDFSVVGGKLKAVRRCHWLLTFERCVNRSDWPATEVWNVCTSRDSRWLQLVPGSSWRAIRIYDSDWQKRDFFG